MKYRLIKDGGIYRIQAWSIAPNQDNPAIGTWMNFGDPHRSEKRGRHALSQIAFYGKNGIEVILEIETSA